MERWTQWVPCKVNVTPDWKYERIGTRAKYSGVTLTLHETHCVHTSMALRENGIIIQLGVPSNVSLKIATETVRTLLFKYTKQQKKLYSVYFIRFWSLGCEFQMSHQLQ